MSAHLVEMHTEHWFELTFHFLSECFGGVQTKRPTSEMSLTDALFLASARAHFAGGPRAPGHLHGWQGQATPALG